MSDQVDIKISKDLIKPIIETKIHQAIVEGMGGAESIIENMAKSILMQKVDSSGKPARYSSSENKTYIDWLCGEVIVDAAKEAIKEWVETKKGDIHKELLRQLSLKRNTSTMVQAVLDGLVSASQSNYNFKLQIEKPNH